MWRTEEEYEGRATEDTRSEDEEDAAAAAAERTTAAVARERTAVRRATSVGRECRVLRAMLVIVWRPCATDRDDGQRAEGRGTVSG
jgi:hypothetical protein